MPVGLAAAIAVAAERAVDGEGVGIGSNRAGSNGRNSDKNCKSELTSWCIS